MIRDILEKFSNNINYIESKEELDLLIINTETEILISMADATMPKDKNTFYPDVLRG